MPDPLGVVPDLPGCFSIRINASVAIEQIDKLLRAWILIKGGNFDPGYQGSCCYVAGILFNFMRQLRPAVRIPENYVPALGIGDIAPVGRGS